MKKLVILGLVFAVLCIASIFGFKLVSNNLVNSAVDKAVQTGSNKYNLPGQGELKDCKFGGKFIGSNPSKKHALFECSSSAGGKVQVVATLGKNGKILFIDKWQFEGLSLYNPAASY